MEPKETVNLFEELGVSAERAHEMDMEIKQIIRDSDYISDILHAIPESYDRESIIMGVFLTEMILIDKGRLLPPGVSRDDVVIVPIPAGVSVVDPTQN